MFLLLLTLIKTFSGMWPVFKQEKKIDSQMLDFYKL